MSDWLPWRAKPRPAPELRSFDFRALAPRLPILSKHEWSLSEWLTDGARSLSLRNVRARLDSDAGCVLLRGFPVEGRPEQDVAADFEKFSRLFGEPSRHGEHGPLVWRVSPRANLDHVPTFSEAASEAPLHTDDCWNERPEDFFALLALRPAADGGESIVISAREVVRELARVPGGTAVLTTLSQPIFPFATPDVFASDSAAHTPACEVGAVLLQLPGGAPGLRYRYDAIQAGFRRHPELATGEARQALALLETLLARQLELISPIKLEAGDVLLADNQRILHGRTDFHDLNRLLFRSRISRSTRP